ncbi:hypothetical protein PAHAL_6G165600 [Panicum hallii]|uniref:Uncharacterized protein n=1 Tax=Panicum hallii TaxID=206008 RepID=A0A2T8IGH3_9POAL|nr:hypothetical protein PAHAL_6G165600 [Panicum hallii]
MGFSLRLYLHPHPLGTPVRRLGVRKPRLAMVFGDLYPSAMQLQMVSVASVLEAMGYEMKVHIDSGGYKGADDIGAQGREGCVQHAGKRLSEIADFW